MSDYTFKAINARIFDLVSKKEQTIGKVQQALNGVDIDLFLKMRLVDIIARSYDDELQMLSKMALVAEWHEMPKAQPNKPNAADT